MTRPSTVVFDLGGVLIDSNPRHHFRAIFEHLLARFRLTASQCLFIDDSEKNPAAARGVGLHAVRFTSPEALRQDLRAHGFAIDPGPREEGRT